MTDLRTNYADGVENDLPAADINDAFGRLNTVVTKLSSAGTLSGNNTGDQNLSGYATTTAVADGYQPLDADLTAIAALTTTVFGRAVLGLADAAALRTAAALGNVDNVSEATILTDALNADVTRSRFFTARTATQGGSHTYTIVSGTVTQIAGTTVNGLTMTVGDRVLINQAPPATGANSGDTTQPGNGLYVVTSIAGGNIAVSRLPEMAGSNSPIGGMIYVVQGDAGGTIKRVTSPTSGAFVWGTTALAIGDQFITQSAMNDILNYAIQHSGANSMSFSATPSFDLGSYFQFNMVLTAPITSASFSNGVDGKLYRLRFKDNGTAQAIALGSTVRAVGVTIPTTTTVSKTMYLTGVWNSTDSKLDIVDVKIEA